MKFTYTPLVNLNNQSSAVANINNNMAAIQTAMEKTLSRDGTSPNAMISDFDMNGHHILNLPIPTKLTDPIRLMDMVGGISTSTTFVALSSYTSLASAVSIIGATNVTLLIDVAASVVSNLTLPSNISISAVPSNLITVGSGATLTVNSPILVPDEQELFSVSGTGKINLNRNGIPVGWFGVFGYNSDNYVKTINMWNATRETGGIYLFGPTAYTYLTNLVVPNTGGTEPTQPPMILKGTGSFNSGRGDFTPSGGTILKFNSGSGEAHISTYGTGHLIIEDLTVQAINNTSLPFIYTTYTTIKTNRVCFFGYNHGISANNDCVIFGGTSNVQDGSSTDAPFQGYGSSITNCSGHKIRRLAVGRMFANAINIKDNWIWATSGNTTGGVIELDGTAGTAIVDFNVGWVVDGNQVEMYNYKYFATLKNAPWNTFQNNQLFDFSGTTTAIFSLLSGSCYRNRFIGGVHTDTTIQFVSDAFFNVPNEIMPGNTLDYRFSEHGPARFSEIISPLTNGDSTLGDIDFGWKQLWLRDAGGSPTIKYQEGQGEIAWSGGNMFYAGVNVAGHYFNAPLGYALGAGGTVTQLTSKSTAVTLNKTSGAITMHNDSLAAGAAVTFTLNNSLMYHTDTIIPMIKSGATTNSYSIDITAVNNGSCDIQLRNISAGALGEAVVVSFMIFRSFHS